MIVLQYTGITAAPSVSPGASMGFVEFGLTTGATIADQSFLGPSSLTGAIIETPAAVEVDGNFQTTVDLSGEGFSDVTSVVVNGAVYPIDYPEAPGAFTFNPSTNTLILVSTTPIPTGATVVVTGIPLYLPPSPTAQQFSTQYPTNWLCESNPAFLSTWNIAGTLQIDRNIRSFPTATFVMLVHKTEKDPVMAFFKPRQKLFLYGCLFECLTPAMVERPRDDFVEISVQMRGGWEREMSEDPVRLFDFSSGNVTQTSLADLCTRAGIGYSGPAIYIYVPAGTTASASTTVLSEASSRGIKNNSFPFLSGTVGLEMRNYETTTLHVLDPGEIMGPITHSKPGLGGEWNGVPLVSEYKNVELQLSQEMQVNKNITESLESGHSRYWEVYRKLGVTAGGDAVETQSPMEARDTNVWWPSGPSKNWRISILLNNSPTVEDEKVYALLGSPLNSYGVRVNGDGDWEDYYFEGFNTQAHWTLVKEVRTTYEYDNDGYLLKVLTRGWQYMNFAAGDLISLRKQYADEEGGDGALLRSLYNQAMLAQFRPPTTLSNSAYNPSSNAPSYTALDRSVGEMVHQVAIRETTTFTLAKMSDYYPDMKCRSDDPDFVEPKFCIEEERVSEDLAFADDPRNIEDSTYQRHQKITGQKRVERKTIEIIYPRKGLSARKYDQRRDKFNTINYNSNYIGGDLSQSSVDEVFSESLGRPGIHTRRIKYKGASVSAPSVTPATNYRVIINTPNSGKTLCDLEEGSVNFPDTFDYETAIAAAKNQINEQNLNAYTLSFDVRPCAAIDWQEGDRVQLFGKLWTILSISQIRNIEGPGRVTSDGWPVTLGLRMNIPITSAFTACRA
jgi:hypothetical protein